LLLSDPPGAAGEGSFANGVWTQDALSVVEGPIKIEVDHFQPPQAVFDAQGQIRGGVLDEKPRNVLVKSKLAP
jgi:hypothetical protein